MLTHQKNTFLGLLANFKARLYEIDVIGIDNLKRHQLTCNIIDRNLTSIEKQIKKL